MTRDEMVESRKAGETVKSIISRSGSPAWYVYDVMRDAGLSRGQPRTWRVKVTRCETVVASSKASAEAIVAAAYPGCEARATLAQSPGGEI